MCYSAQIWADYKKYTRAFGATIDIATFTDIFWSRLEDEGIKLPKGLEDAFSAPTDKDESHIKVLIDQYKAKQASKFEQELFKQRKRLADAERTLLAKTTKAATESKRISTSKIDWALTKLSDLRRTDLKASDSRIYPGYYAPVMVMENGKRVIKPSATSAAPRVSQLSTIPSTQAPTTPAATT